MMFVRSIGVRASLGGAAATACDQLIPNNGSLMDGCVGGEELVEVVEHVALVTGGTNGAEPGSVVDQRRQRRGCERRARRWWPGHAVRSAGHIGFQDQGARAGGRHIGFERFDREPLFDRCHRVGLHRAELAHQRRPRPRLGRVVRSLERESSRRRADSHARRCSFTGRLHQPGRAIARSTVADHQQDVALSGQHEVGPWVVVSLGDRHGIGHPSRLQSTGCQPRPCSGKQVAGVRCHHLGQIERGHVEPGVADPRIRNLQFAEQVLAARRPPVRADGHQHSMSAGRHHIGGLVVQPQVRERRPHDASRRCAVRQIGVHVPLPELLVADSAAVDRNQAMSKASGGGDIGELASHLAPAPAFAKVVHESPTFIEQCATIVELSRRQVDH